jgi:membrane protease YdiL (CAAX protease family)
MVMTDAASQNLATSPSVTTSEPLCLRTELGFAAEACLAAYAPTIAVRLLVVMLMKQFNGEAPPSHPFLEMLDNDSGAMVLLLVALTAVVVAPVVEELQYRVVLLGGLAQVGMTWPALALSSLLFSLAHGMPDGIALIPLALALGYTYLRRRSCITVMLVHFLFNAFNLLVALLGMM